MSPKSTIDWMSRRSSRSIRPSCSPASRYACATSPVSSWPSSACSVSTAPVWRAGRSVAIRPTRAQRDRADGPLEQLEGRQQPDQHLLGIAPHDQQRQQVLEHDEEPGHRQQQHAGILHVVDAGQRREDDGGDGDDQPEQQADRDEQQHRVVEVGPQARRAAVALDGEAQRQPHQRAEGGLDGPDVRSWPAPGRRARRGSSRGSPGRRRLARGGWRSMSPPSRPPRRRSRCSSRRIAPVSAS